MLPAGLFMVAKLSGEIVDNLKLVLQPSDMETGETGSAEGAMVDVAAFAELTEGVLKLVRAGEARVALVRRGDTVSAVAARCTHARIFLAPGKLTADGMIECPLHGAKFSPDDGSVQCPPATAPLAVHSVLVRDGRVLVDPVGACAAPAAAAAASQANPWANWS